MARALVRWLPMEMALLGLFEFVASFFSILAMLLTGDAVSPLESGALTRDCLVLAAMLAVTIAGVAATIGLYRPEVCLNRRHLLLTCTVAALLAFPAILLVSGGYRVTLSFDHIVWLARLLLIWLAVAMLVRLGLSLLAVRLPVTRGVLIVGGGARAVGLRRRLLEKPRGLFEPVGRAREPVADSREALGDGREPLGDGREADALSDLTNAIACRRLSDAKVWGIVIAGGEVPAPARAALLASKLRGARIFSDAAFQEQHLGRIEIDAIDENWLLAADGFRDSRAARAVKRTFDVVVGSILLVVTLPLMLVTAIAIRLESPGPIFYRQVRTGLFGAAFTLFKFRSMTADAEVAGQPQWARERDPRVTRVGAFIRASRIDELPQLLNVLCGEMSMIGPRPERPMFVEELARVIPFYGHRDYVKPGLTGWAQVNYPYGASVEDAREKLAYDLYYVKNRGLLLDLLILFSTVRVILFREGAR